MHLQALLQGVYLFLHCDDGAWLPHIISSFRWHQGSWIIYSSCECRTCSLPYRCLQGWAVFKMDWRLTKAEVTFMSPAPCSTPGIHWGEPHHLCHADFNSDFFLGETWRSGCVKRTDWTLPPPWFRWAGFQLRLKPKALFFRQRRSCWQTLCAVSTMLRRDADQIQYWSEPR